MLIHHQRLRALDAAQRVVGWQGILEDSEEYDDAESPQEDEHGILGRLRNLLVECGGTAAIDILVLLGILQLSLEHRILVEILATMVAGSSGSHQTTDAGGDRHHQHTRNGDVETVGIGYAHKGHHGSGDGRTGDTDLRGNRGYAAGALRTDAFLQGDVADNRHQRIDHVTRSYKHSQEECTQRSEEGDAVWMLAQQLLRNLNEPVHTARGLHDTSTGDGSDDDVDHVGRRCARLQTKAEDEDGQADARDGAKG